MSQLRYLVCSNCTGRITVFKNGGFKNRDRFDKDNICIKCQEIKNEV